MYSKNCDIIAITETCSWLSDNLLDQEIIPTGYTIYCKDQYSQGWWYDVSCKNSILSHALDIPIELEALCVQIGNNDSITLCLVYIPPNSLELYIQPLCNYMIKSTYYFGILIFIPLIGIYFRDNSKGGCEGLKTYLLNFDFSPCFQSHNIKFIWSYIESTLINAIYQFNPRMKIHDNQKPR